VRYFSVNNQAAGVLIEQVGAAFGNVLPSYFNRCRC